MFRYRLVNEHGADLGPFETSEPRWGAGDRIYRGRDTLEVVDVVAQPDDVHVLVVKRA